MELVCPDGLLRGGAAAAAGPEIRNTSWDHTVFSLENSDIFSPASSGLFSGRRGQKIPDRSHW